MTPEARRELANMTVTKHREHFVLLIKGKTILRTQDHEELKKEFGSRIRRIRRG